MLKALASEGSSAGNHNLLQLVWQVGPETEFNIFLKVSSGQALLNVD